MLVVLFAWVVGSAAFPAALYAQPSKSVWDGVYTEEQQERGVEVYERECLACHGAQLEGAEAPALADTTFKANWDGLTLADLFGRIRETMPPTSPGSIPRQDLADVLAHILYVNGMPAGENELERRSATLSMIRFDAYKPEP